MSGHPLQFLIDNIGFKRAMPFKKTTVMEEKLEFVRLAVNGGIAFTKLCERFNISRPTGYKWLKNYRKEGPTGLYEESRRPQESPGAMAPSIVELIVKLKTQEPHWGAKKLHVLLHRDYRDQLEEIPSLSTINRILSRHQLTKIRKNKPLLKTGRFERLRPNELWQMDFKGHFALEDSKRCHPLTVTDDYSRFNILLLACANERGITVQLGLERAFKKYGLPDTILCDNGSPWGSSHLDYHRPRRTITKLESWLIQLGVKMIHGRPYHPQTQGKCERFHKTLKQELLLYNCFKDYAHCQKEFDLWRDKYNLYRPHEGINFEVPAKRFQISPKAFPKSPQERIHGINDQLLKVSAKGYIHYQGKRYYAGEGLGGQIIALRNGNNLNKKDVYYCNKKVRSIPSKV